MIVNIDNENALWFGMNLKAAKEVISYTEGIFRLCEAAGFSREEVRAKYKEIGGDNMLARAGRSGIPDNTDENFTKKCRSYFSEFGPSTTHPAPDFCSVIGYSAAITTSKEGLAKFIVHYFAPK